MRKLKATLSILIFTIISALCLFSSCKSKKLIAQESPVQSEAQTVVAVAVPKPAAVADKDTDGDGIPDSRDNCPDKPGTAANNGCPEIIAPEPVINYQNILFEFNSAILKTSSYPILDEISRAMKNYPAMQFSVNGHSSAEGTADHNMSLSVARATAVKIYLVNTGVSSNNLAVKGFGESVPLKSNDSEAGRLLNRRVEIKKY